MDTEKLNFVIILPYGQLCEDKRGFLWLGSAGLWMKKDPDW